MNNNIGFDLQLVEEKFKKIYIEYNALKKEHFYSKKQILGSFNDIERFNIFYDKDDDLFRWYIYRLFYSEIKLLIIRSEYDIKLNDSYFDVAFRVSNPIICEIEKNKNFEYVKVYQSINYEQFINDNLFESVFLEYTCRAKMLNAVLSRKEYIDYPDLEENSDIILNETKDFIYSIQRESMEIEVLIKILEKKCNIDKAHMELYHTLSCMIVRDLEEYNDATSAYAKGIK